MTYILSFLLVNLDRIDRERLPDKARDSFSRALLFEEPPSARMQRVA